MSDLQYLDQIMMSENQNNNPHSMHTLNGRKVSFSTFCKNENIGKIK